MDTERLKKLAEKKSGWTKADKEWLTPILEQYGIEIPSNEKCPSCWRDAAIMVAVKMKSDEQQPINGLRLRGDAATVGVFWKGVFVHPSVMTTELADWLIETNFPKQCYES